MTKISKIALACASLFFSASSVFATEYTKGTVKKVDAKAGKVTVIHEELKNLDMPAMTMVFRPADDAMLEKLKAGDNIEFVADRVNGKLTIVEIK
ncbi:copper-binding protein [Stappia sp. F7233]|uniref:Copper-binding protein n=1 Tax=Stappia albiluteola TaxID=2758565 RepID=A0A839A9D2_9HYPH|nr:copper-binding protein [Stappia albiluteola]MBA5775557.1 copper-binding protein [Stappia albiluteola]